jgi:serine/threonine protein kinase
LGDYELKRRLGRGASGEVRLAVHHITGDRRAIKICPKGNIASLARLDTEIKVRTVTIFLSVTKFNR